MSFNNLITGVRNYNSELDVLVNRSQLPTPTLSRIISTLKDNIGTLEQQKAELEKENDPKEASTFGKKFTLLVQKKFGKGEFDKISQCKNVLLTR